MEPNFVLMKLPGKTEVEFVEILPFTPSNRNNLIGWIAGRSDGANYGTALVYDFPKTRLVDGPAADRSAHRPERTALRTTLPVEPAGLARAPRHPARDPVRQGPDLRRADLPPSRAQPHAGVAPRRARAPGQAGLRRNLRSGSARALRRGFFVGQRRTGPTGAECGGPIHCRPRRSQCVSSKEQHATSPTTSALPSEGKLGEAGQKLEQLKQKLDALNARRK